MSWLSVVVNYVLHTLYISIYLYIYTSISISISISIYLSIHLSICLYIYIYTYKFTSKCLSRTTPITIQDQETFLASSADKQTRNHDTECSNHDPSLLPSIGQSVFSTTTASFDGMKHSVMAMLRPTCIIWLCYT